MSEIIVCAEPTAKKEAAEFVEQLGAESKLRSFNFSLSDLKGKKSLLVYLRGDEPKSVLRHCLLRIRAKHNLTAVIYSAAADQYKAAEWGKVVGELRPKGTYICFAKDEVRRYLKLSIEEGKDVFSRALDLGAQNAWHHVLALRKELTLTQADVAEAVGVTNRTVQNWESRKQIPARKTRDLDELLRLLHDYMNADQIAKWMDSSNDAFGGLTPRGLIREGKTRDIILEFRRMQTGESL
jgi:DNA-binding transcriptional regulator YiaG